MRFRSWSTKGDIENYRWRNKIWAEQERFCRRAAVVLGIIGLAAAITVVIGLIIG